MYTVPILYWNIRRSSYTIEISFIDKNRPQQVLQHQFLISHFVWYGLIKKKNTKILRFHLYISQFTCKFSVQLSDIIFISIFFSLFIIILNFHIDRKISNVCFQHWTHKSLIQTSWTSWPYFARKNHFQDGKTASQ